MIGVAVLLTRFRQADFKAHPAQSNGAHRSPGTFLSSIPTATTSLAAFTLIEDSEPLVQCYLSAAMEQERGTKRRKLESESDHPQPRGLQSSWPSVTSGNITYEDLAAPMIRNGSDYDREFQLPPIQTISRGPFPPVNGVSNTFRPALPTFAEGQSLLGSNVMHDNGAITYDLGPDMDTNWAALPPIWNINHGEQHFSGDPPQHSTWEQKCTNPHADSLDESPDWNPNDVAVTEHGWASGTSQDLFSPTGGPRTSVTSQNAQSTPWTTPRPVLGTPAPGSFPSLSTESDQEYVTNAGATSSPSPDLDMRGSSHEIHSESDGGLTNPPRDNDSDLLCFGMVSQRDSLVRTRAYKLDMRVECTVVERRQSSRSFRIASSASRAESFLLRCGPARKPYRFAESRGCGCCCSGYHHGEGAWSRRGAGGCAIRVLCHGRGPCGRLEPAQRWRQGRGICSPHHLLRASRCQDGNRPDPFPRAPLPAGSLLYPPVLSAIR